MYRVLRLSQGQAPVVVDDLPTETEAERLCATCERLPHDRLTGFIVEAPASDADAGYEAPDEADFFAIRDEQRTLYQEGVCRPGWVGPMPEPPAAPLYVPNAPHAYDDA